MSWGRTTTTVSSTQSLFRITIRVAFMSARIFVIASSMASMALSRTRISWARRIPSASAM